MKVVFIRHGESNYTDVINKKLTGFGVDMADISERGIVQAKQAANDSLLNGSQLILSSPYTRAMQTASIISKHNQLDVLVELDLHEWIPDTTYNYTIDTYNESQKEFYYNKGVYNIKCKHHWEDMKSVSKRVTDVLDRYLEYQKIIVVSHGIVMRQFICTETGHILNCSAYEVDYNEDFETLPFDEKMYADLLR